MCSNPQALPDGVLIGCRNCKQCRGRKVLDWTGRCIAESRTSKAASVVTLTYGGGDHVRAAVLTYSDVQKWFKVLRKRGYPLKYLATGEYGTLKGRCHWHIIVYWQDRVYPHVNMQGRNVGDFEGDTVRRIEGDWDGETRGFKPPVGKAPARYFDDSWPHGHMVWDVPDVAAIKYATKYLLKDTQDDAKQYHLAMSKKPPLGDAYFRQRAERHVEAGLAPQDLIYEFEEARDRDGKRLRFQMGGATARNFLQCFVDTWKEKRPGEIPPYSEIVEVFLDKQIDGTVEDWDRALLFEKQLREAPTQEEIKRKEYSEAHNAFFFGANMRRLYSGEIFTDEQAKQEKAKERKPGYGADVGTFAGQPVAHWDYGGNADTFPGDLPVSISAHDGRKGASGDRSG